MVQNSAQFISKSILFLARAILAVTSAALPGAASQLSEIQGIRWRSAQVQSNLHQTIPYLLPEDFKVYIDVKNDSVINHPAPGYKEKVLPTVNKYIGNDGGYIACYSRNPNGSIYSAGGGTFVMGQIRLQGKYTERIFEPKGYEGTDISANQELKNLCNQTFPSAKDGGWAGGDTGGWFGIP